jgi:hypothetical protein
MGRSIVSIRQGVKGLSEHWARVPRALRPEDRAAAEHLVQAVKKHSSEAFFGCDDPLEAAVFSALVEIARHQDEMLQGQVEGEYVDP